MSDDKAGRSAIFRFVHKLGDGGKNGQENLAWVQRKVLGIFKVDWFPYDNRRRFAMIEFKKLIEQAEDMLRLYDSAKNDNTEGLNYIRSNNQRKGISQWYEAELVPREELLPDITEEFLELRKKYSEGSGGRRQRLKSPDHATRSQYLWPTGRALPSGMIMGREVDHEIDYREPQKNQQQPNRKRKQNRGGGQQQQDQDQQD